MKAKKLLLLSALLAPLFALTAHADDPVEVGGIMYNLVPKGKVATVTSNHRNIQGQDDWGNTQTYNVNYYGSIVIPPTIIVSGTTYTVVGIEDGAFNEGEVNSNPKKYRVSSVTIPESVTSIGEGAFSNCSSLTSVTIPASVTSIGGYAFSGCSLTSVTISDLGAWCKISFSGLDSNPLFHAHHLFLNEEEIKDLVIPNGVTSIGRFAFIGCSGLTSVTIPASVTSIGLDAFSYCSSLTSVTIPESVTSIDYYCFYGCSSLTSVSIPASVGRIPVGCFSGCSSLTSVTIPESVGSIGQSAFDGCSSLTSVTIPEPVGSIGQSAFKDCSSLTSIVLPKVSFVDAQAFYGCTQLRSVTMEFEGSQGGIEFVSGYIGSKAFANCSNLEEFNTHAYGRFGWQEWDETEQTTITRYGDWATTSVESDAFDGSFVEYATLHVPEAAIGLYKADATWSKFGTITSLGSAAKYYKLFVEVNEKGKVVYGTDENAKTITGATQTFDVKEQEDIVLTLTANEGYKLDKVTVNGVDKTSAVTAEGKLTITGVNGNQTVSVAFVYGGNSVALTIGELGAATFCCTEALDFSGTDDVKAYIASAFRPSTGTVTLTRITDVPAGTGIVVLGEAGTYSIPLGAGETYVVNLLVGTAEAKTLSKTEGANSNFILADGENGVGFYAVSSGSTLEAGKAYLSLPTSALPTNAQSIGLRFGDGTTGIRSMENGAWATDNEADAWFGIDGRRMDGRPTERGLHIVNGKKVIVK